MPHIIMFMDWLRPLHGLRLCAHAGMAPAIVNFPIASTIVLIIVEGLGLHFTEVTLETLFLVVVDVYIKERFSRCRNAEKMGFTGVRRSCCSKKFASIMF